MHPLIPIVVAVCVADILLSLSFFFFHRTNQQESMRWWGWAWLVGLAVHTSLCAIFLGSEALWLQAIFGLGLATHTLLLLKGAYVFLGRPVPWVFYPLLVGAILWMFVTHRLETPFLVAQGPLAFFFGVAFLSTGISLWRWPDRNVGFATAALGMIAAGLHWWDFPFLGDIPAVQIWGFLAGLCLLMVIGGGILLGGVLNSHQLLELSESRYRSLFDNALEGMFRCDSSGRIVDANPAFCSLLGFPSSDLVGRSLDEFFTEQEGLPSAWGGDPPVDVQFEEVVYTDADDVRHTVCLNARPALDQTGQSRLWDGFVRDLTSQRTLRTQLEASQRMEVLGQLAGGIAHEFNNMLTVIEGSAVLLGEERGGKEELLDLITGATERAASVTSHLLAFARRHEVTLKTVDLVALVQDLGALIERTLGDDIEVTVKTGWDFCYVSVDKQLLEQAILNLALNARDAMPSGGNLTLEVERSQEMTPLGSDTPCAILTVTDTGHGFSDTVKPHLFEPFFTTRPDSQGTGLGLSLVHGIVGQFGGAIEAESLDSQGAVFRISLPLSTDAPEIVHESLPPTFPSAATASRILVVEDEEMVRKLAATILKSAGYEVVTAQDGEAALGELLDNRFDLVLSDIVMPRMTGTELSARIAEEYPETRVVLMTGYSGGSADLSQKANSVPVLRKPWGAQELLEVVALRLKPAKRTAGSASATG